MKRVTSTVTYTVPHWNFCNEDNFDYGGTPVKATCRFCVKDKSGHHCLLYDKSLSVNNGLIQKVPACCDATAGFKSVIEPTEVPTIEPKVLMKQTIDLYEKTVKDLMAQGYPQPIAAATAKKFVLGG
jgi:hypothetical protein